MNKTPLVHISKRDEVPWYKAWMVRCIAIVLAVILCSAITILVTGNSPIAVMKSFVDGNFETGRKTWVTFQDVAILLIISLAVTPAFKMKFWNIGAEGQVLIGCLAAAACMITLGDRIPNALLYVIMTVSSIVSAAIWAVIPGFFKARWNTNETLFTLMMNYIATQLVAYFVIIWENPKGSGTIGVINPKTRAGWMQLGNKYLLPIIISAALTLLLYIYLKYTKHGYEISVVGESPRTARYAGIKVEKVIIRTMILSGAICGIAGLLIVGSINYTLNTALAGGNGFTAVMVSWLAKFNPIFMSLTSFLLVFMSRGASEVATTFGLNESFSDILTGIIIFFIIGSEFFIRYKLVFAKSLEKEGK